MSQGYLLELMLATWRHEKGKGGTVPGVGLLLPEKMLMAAGALAHHLDVSIETAICDAIAERMVSSGLAKVKSVDRHG